MWVSLFVFYLFYFDIVVFLGMLSTHSSVCLLSMHCRVNLEFLFYIWLHFVIPVCQLRSNNLPWEPNLIRACLPVRRSLMYVSSNLCHNWAFTKYSLNTLPDVMKSLWIINKVFNNLWDVSFREVSGAFLVLW